MALRPFAEDVWLTSVTSDPVLFDVLPLKSLLRVSSGQAAASTALIQLCERHSPIQVLETLCRGEVIGWLNQYEWRRVLFKCQPLHDVLAEVVSDPARLLDMAARHGRRWLQLVGGIQESDIPLGTFRTAGARFVLGRSRLQSAAKVLIAWRQHATANAMAYIKCYTDGRLADELLTALVQCLASTVVAHTKFWTRIIDSSARDGYDDWATRLAYVVVLWTRLERQHAFKSVLAYYNAVLRSTVPMPPHVCTSLVDNPTLLVRLGDHNHAGCVIFAAASQPSAHRFVAGLVKAAHFAQWIGPLRTALLIVRRQTPEHLQALVTQINSGCAANVAAMAVNVLLEVPGSTVTLLERDQPAVLRRLLTMG